MIKQNRLIIYFKKLTRLLSVQLLLIIKMLVHVSQVTDDNDKREVKGIRTFRTDYRGCSNIRKYIK